MTAAMSLVTSQPDLFGEPQIAGLSVAGEIVTPQEERALIAGVDASPLAPFRFHGWLGKRLTTSYGWHYDFADASFTPTAPIPAWLLPLCARAARLAGLAPEELVQSLLIRYDPGAGIGWHRDRPVFAHVLGVSLARRRRCAFAGAGPAGSSGRASCCNRARSTTSPARRGTSGSTASPMSRRRAGRSPFAASRLRAGGGPSPCRGRARRDSRRGGPVPSAA